MQKPILKNPITWIIVALLVAGAGYAAFANGLLNLNFFSQETPAESEEFIARVNGEGLKTALFDLRLSQMRTALEAQGTTLSEEDLETLRQRTLSDMVSEMLLAQYGREQGFEATNELIETEYDLLVSQFPSEEVFKTNIASQGATVEDVRQTIAQDLVLRQVIEQQTEQNNTGVSEEEIRQVYEESAEQNPEIPPLEEARPQIEAFLQQQKIGEALNVLLDQLRADAMIEVLS